MMRLSREKINRLGQIVTEVLVSSDEVQFIEDRETIRQAAIKILQDLIKQEEQIDSEVRRKISSQKKKEVIEGTPEWSVLYHKYYSDELRRLGIAEAPRT